MTFVALVVTIIAGFILAADDEFSTLKAAMFVFSLIGFMILGSIEYGV